MRRSTLTINPNWYTFNALFSTSSFFEIAAGSNHLTNEECTPYTVQYAYDTYAMAHGTSAEVINQDGKT